MQWYYSKNGTQLGPVDESALRSKLASGELSPSDLVWREGLADWLPAARVPEFQSSPTAAAPGPLSPPVSAPPLGQPQPQPYSPPLAHGTPSPQALQIPNYLWQSIVVTLLCCLPFGIVGIVFAAKVDGLKQAGDINGALAASKNAKLWCMIGAGCGLVVVVLWVLLMIFAAAAAPVHSSGGSF